EKREDARRHLLASMGDYAQLLKRFSPMLHKFSGCTEAKDALALDRAEAQFYDAIVDFFLRMSEGTPGAIVIRADVQGDDEGLRQFLQRIALTLRRHRVLVVCADRNDDEGRMEGDPLVEEIKTAQIHTLTLNPLYEVSIARLVSGMLGKRKVD